MRRSILAGALCAAVVGSGLVACSTKDDAPPPFATDVSAPVAARSSAATSVLTPASSAASTAAASTPNLSTTAAWSEDFTGPAGSAPDPGLLQSRTGGNGWGNQEVETYTDRASNASLNGNGQLAINAVREKLTGTDGIKRNWTSARLDSLGKWAFTTGTVSIRMKLPDGTGMWPAFWLQGADIATNPWPKCGEIDVIEALGAHRTVYQSIHGPDGSKAGYAQSAQTKVPAGVSISAAYHTFAVTRTAKKIVFSIDGKLSGQFTPDNLTGKQQWVFDKPMFLLVNLAVGGWPGAPSAKTPSPSTLLVDWIRYAP